MPQFLFSFFLVFGVTLYAQESNYKLGEGIKLGNSSIYLGGYASVNYENTLGTQSALKLDELAIMAYGEYDNFSYMFEIEADDVYSEVFANESSDVVNGDFHIERLYLNYEFNENYSLMLGKYNSPIGFWNRVPINVLRDTSSNPIISTLLFPKFTSGVDVHYNFQNAQSGTFDILLQATEDIDEILHENTYNNFDVDRHYGAGASFQDNQWTYQVNAGYFHLTGGDEYYYLLGAFKYTYEAVNLQAELGTQFDEHGATVPFVGYVQGSYMINEYHEAIARVEYYDDKSQHTEDSFAVIGYTYRPLYPVALKAEYQWHSLAGENQFLLSISVLF